MTTGTWTTGSAPSTSRLGEIAARASLVAAFGPAHGRVVVDAEVVATSPCPPCSPGNVPLVVEVILHGRDGATLTAARSVVPPVTDRPAVVRVVVDAPGVDPWWPRALGSPHRHRLAVRLLVDGVELDRFERRIGFRTVELDTSPDALGAGFGFVVNDVAMFARGVAWDRGATLTAATAPDTHSPRHESPHTPPRDALDHVDEVVRWLRDAEVDLVRVHGDAPGVPAALVDACVDTLIDACDELGVLVWFDLARHGDVLARLRADVHRLRHHPSVAIWCGGDEQPDDAARADDSRRCDHSLWCDDVPLALEVLDADRAYWPGVPSDATRSAPGHDLHGCVQLQQPDDVHHRACRFVAGIGRPPRRAGAAPHARTDLADLADAGSDDRGTDDPGTDDVALAREARTAIEHFRSLRGHCLGVVWTPPPGTDARHPAWHAARAAFADRLLTVQPRGRHLVLHVVNDGRVTWRATGTATRLALDGTVRICQPFDVVVAPRSIARVELDPCVAWARDPGGEVIAVDAAGVRTWWWFAGDDELRLPPPQLRGDVEPLGRGRFALSLTSTTVVRDLVIDVDRLVPGATVDRQLVTMWPGDAERFVVDAATGTDAGLEALFDTRPDGRVMRTAEAPRRAG